MVNGVRITGDISSGDRVVAPGQTEDLEIPMPPTAPELIVVAAMFADGSIEGDAAVAGELRQWRFNAKEIADALSVVSGRYTGVAGDGYR